MSRARSVIGASKAAAIGALGMLVLSLLACQTLLGSGAPTPRPEIEASIEAFGRDGADVGAAFDVLEEQIRQSPAEIEQAALRQLNSDQEQVRLAAVYALARTYETAAGRRGLQQQLASEDVTLRLLAAAGLLIRGEAEAIPVLIAALREDEPLAFSQPPQLAWEYARALLLQYVEPEFGLLAAEDFGTVGVIAGAYEVWWESSAETIAWDETRLRFREQDQ